MIQNIMVVTFVTLLGCLGGQFFKAQRRWGIPLIGMGVALKKEKRWKSLAFILLGAVLTMGYGVNSKLSKVFPYDWQRRIAYGVLLAVPFMFFGMFIPLIVLPITWSVPFPFSFKALGVEWLWEDILFRYLPLGVFIVLI